MNYYNEWDQGAAAWLRELIAEGLIAPGVVDTRSITEIKPDELADYKQCHFFAGIGGWPLAFRIAGWPDDRPVWSGSCPCQPFAGCGKGAGFSDPRHLWPSWYHLIKERRPSVVIGEQVASALALEWLDHVFDDLEGENYACGAADLCAAGVGSTQIRQRFYWVADSNDERRERAKWERQPYQAREEWEAARREPLRSDRRYWPPGPREVHLIPSMANGLPGTMGGCKGYGNAIVPQLAAEFIQAFAECF